MVLETLDYDPAEFMTQPQDVFYFVQAELEENEPSYWPGTGSIVAKARGGFAQLARESGLTALNFQEAADESTPTSRDILIRIVEAFRPESASDYAEDKAIHAL